MAVSFQEHRIYKRLGLPLRIVGLTVDEILVAVGCFLVSVFMTHRPILGVSLMIGSLFAVWGLKKAKKTLKGASVRSFFYWKGVWPAPSRKYPKFYEGRYRG